MAYKPIQPQGSGFGSTVSTMAKSGLNLRDLPQLLSPDNALRIENYLITAEGGLEKRGGIKEFFDTAQTEGGITLLEKWTDDFWIFGYYIDSTDKQALGAYQISTDTLTAINTDIAVTDGVKYGNYFFVASSSQKITRLEITIDYDNQTSNFTVGDTVTGGTSGATALILADADAGTSGTLTLGNIVGEFQDGELLTDGSGGSADANGGIGVTDTEITNAPIAEVLAVIDARLFAGNLSDDPTAVQYSEVDDGSNPPFDSWSTGATATDGGTAYFRNAGAVNVIDNLGPVIIIGADDGKWAFIIDTIDSAGVLTKVETRVMQREDAGMQAALQTKEGLFYVNSQGLWQLQSVGQSNISFSDQEFLVSEQLGDNFFKMADFSNADLVKDDVTNQLLITYRDDSAENNKVLVYNTQLKSFAQFTGWQISRFANDDGTIYAGNANISKTYTVFDGDSDDGSDIWTCFEQELNVGAFWTRKELYGQYIQGELSGSTQLDINFSIYDRDGLFISDKLKLRWTASNGLGLRDEFGTAAWGGSPWGGDADLTGLIDNFAGFHGRIKNFQRIRVKIQGHDQVPHVINWMSLETKEKANIRRRNLTKI